MDQNLPLKNINGNDRLFNTTDNGTTPAVDQETKIQKESNEPSEAARELDKTFEQVDDFHQTEDVLKEETILQTDNIQEKEEICQSKDLVQKTNCLTGNIKNGLSVDDVENGMQIPLLSEIMIDKESNLNEYDIDGNLEDALDEG